MPKDISTLFIAAILLLIGASAFLASCNTVAGAGKDVSRAGHAVTDTANEAKKHK